MILKNIFNKAREEKFIVLYISTNLTMNFDTHKIIVQLIEKYKPNHWKLLNPSGYIIHYLLNDKNKSLSNSIYGEIVNLILKDHRFSDHEIGKSEGPLIAEFSMRGKIISDPMGMTENYAMQNLKGINNLQT